MSEATHSPNETTTLEQSLNRTDFGHFVFEHRKSILSALVAALVGVTGYFLWGQSQKSKALDVAAEVFEFNSKAWGPAKEDKLSTSDLVKQFEALDKSVQTSPSMIPVALEMSKFLVNKGALNEAEVILSKIEAKNSMAGYFVATQRSVVLEKLGKIDEAIVVLEKMPQDKDAFMVARVNVELGRLNLLKGDKARARTHFDYVLSNYPNDEQAKLAKLYLGQL